MFNWSLMVKVVSLHGFSNIIYTVEKVSAEVPNVEWGAKQTEEGRVALAPQPQSPLDIGHYLGLGRLR